MTYLLLFDSTEAAACKMRMTRDNSATWMNDDYWDPGELHLMGHRYENSWQ